MPKLTLTEESKTKLKENQEFTDKWIAGLRSGKWMQCREMMVYPEIPNSCCCLMVAEIECNGAKWEDGIRFDKDAGELCNSGWDVPSDMASPSVWTEGLVAINEYGRTYQVVDWNDDLVLSFNKIADLLENGEVEYGTD